MKIRNRVAEIARAKGYRCADLANAIGARKQTVQHWFKNRNNPTMPLLGKVLEILEVQEEELFYTISSLQDHAPT